MRRTVISLVLAGLTLAACLLPSPALARTPEFALEDTGPTRNQAMLKSLLWPGLGQMAQGREVRGAVWAGGAAMWVMGTFYTHQHYHSAVKDYDNAMDSFRNALDAGSPNTAQYYFEQLSGYHEQAEDRYSWRQKVELGLLVWWGANLVDTWLFHGGEKTGSAIGLTALPGGLEPVVREDACGLAWTLDF